MSSTHAKLIVIDGGEGSGKDTIINKAKAAFPNILFTREPGGTAYAEEQRELLLGDLGKGISFLAQLLGMMSARADHMDKVIRPALERGQHVVSNRFDTSTFAYQVAHDRSLLGLFEDLRSRILGSIKPIYVYLDVDPDTGLKRRAGDALGEMNHFDRRGLDYHTLVSEGFRTFFERLPDGQFYRIDARPAQEVVLADALKVIGTIIA